MSVPAEVLTGINEAMVDGGVIVGFVLVALVGMYALRMIRQGASWSESAEKDRQWNAATGWQEDEAGRFRVVD